MRIKCLQILVTIMLVLMVSIADAGARRGGAWVRGLPLKWQAGPLSAALTSAEKSEMVLYVYFYFQDKQDFPKTALFMIPGVVE